MELGEFSDSNLKTIAHLPFSGKNTKYWQFRLPVECFAPQMTSIVFGDEQNVRKCQHRNYAPCPENGAVRVIYPVTMIAVCI